MRIMMITNTYLPHVGGVARSVHAFTEAYRSKRHRVRVVAPDFEGITREEGDVVRVKAIQNFNGSDFSVVVRSDGVLQEALEDFKPDIIHSHHPFLMGGAAQRLAAVNHLPLVFTHHTLYEEYTHYVPGDSGFMKRFVTALSMEYANMANHIIAPSESIRDMLVERGLETPAEVIPTGVPAMFFDTGDGLAFRRIMGIKPKAFVVGHVGRLAPEKNLPFLADTVASFLKNNRNAVFLLVGGGPSLSTIEETCRKYRVSDQLVTTGVLNHPILISAYKAMDVFAFASQSETQGMVLTEAMATGVPVIGVDANGVREVIREGRNGTMLASESKRDFIAALQKYHDMSQAELRKLKNGARRFARAYSLDRCAGRALDLYRSLVSGSKIRTVGDDDTWNSLVSRLETEWNAVSTIASAAGRAMIGSDGNKPPRNKDQAAA